MKKILRTCVSVLALTVFATGCGIVDELLAEQAADSVDLAQNESALSTAAMEGVDETTTPDEAATIAIDNAGIYFKPAGCAVGTIDPLEPNKISWEINGCTGPYGFVTISGTVDVEYTAIPGGLQAHYSGQGVQFNQSVMDIDTTAKRTFVGTGRTLDVITHSSGVGSRGHQIQRDGEYLITWDIETNCLGMDGAWQTKVDNKTWNTTIDNWERCEGECPKSGGHIEFEGGMRDVTVTIDYDGSPNAAWKSSRGSSGSLDLNCS